MKCTHTRVLAPARSVGVCERDAPDLRNKHARVQPTDRVGDLGAAKVDEQITPVWCANHLANLAKAAGPLVKPFCPLGFAGANTANDQAAFGTG